MGRLFFHHEGGSKIYSCRVCRVYLTNRGEMLSARFQGSTGTAYLFDRAWNVDYSEAQVRDMLTGKHIVRDVLCIKCGQKLGWMYEFAYEDGQRYKESKVILEKALIKEEDGIEDPELGEHYAKRYSDEAKVEEQHIETFKKIKL